MAPGRGLVPDEVRLSNDFLSPSPLHARDVWLSPSAVRALYRRETLPEAVAAAVTAVLGVKAYVIRYEHPTLSGVVRAVTFSPDGVHYAYVGIDDWEASHWSHCGTKYRLRLLRRTMTKFRSTRTRTIEQSLQCPYEDDQRWSWNMACVVPLWIGARVAEGHTPESARMMLGLTLPSASWKHLP